MKNEEEVTNGLHRAVVTAIYAAGVLALSAGLLNLWFAREAVGDFIGARQLWIPAGVVVSCVILRLTWLTGDRRTLRSRTSVIAAFGIIAGLVALVLFVSWQSLGRLLERAA